MCVCVFDEVYIRSLPVTTRESVASYGHHDLNLLPQLWIQMRLRKMSEEQVATKDWTA